MFIDLDLINRFNIDYVTLCRLDTALPQLLLITALQVAVLGA